MSRKQGKVRSSAEYAVFYILYKFFALAPSVLREAAISCMAALWRGVDRRHFRRAAAQSRERLGIGEDEAAGLARRVYRHFVTLAAEVAALRDMPLDEVRERIDVNGGDVLIRDALARGKGIILLTGHLGNWEWGGVLMGMLGLAEGALARPLDNPYLNAWINGVRGRGGLKVWNRYVGMRPALTAVQAGRGVIAVVDQDGGRRGYFAPFLGRPASTMAAPVNLAMQTGAPLYVGALMRTGGFGRFTLESGGIHWPDPNADPEAERIRLLTAVNDDISAIIRKYPEQWIWFQRRWRTYRAKNGEVPPEA